MRARLRAARQAWARGRVRADATVGGRVGGAAVCLLLAGALIVGVAAPPEHCPTVTQGDLRDSATAAVDWFARNQRADGTWLYLYDRTTGQEDGEPYNVVRHAGAILGLEQAATAGIAGARESADRGTDWILGKVIERGDWLAVSYRGEVAVGTSALLVAGLAERRAATGDDAHDEVLRGLGRFLASQVEPSGAVLAYYDLGAWGPVPETYSKYYTGEAYWALARLHRLFPDQGWDEPAGRVGHYLATERDDAEGHTLAIPDHWAAYGLAETAGTPSGPTATDVTSASGDDTRGDAGGEAGRALTDAERTYARNQAGAFGVQVRWFAQLFGPWGSPTRWFRGVPRGGGYGVVGEALSGLWRVARAEPELADIEGPVAERALCNAGQALEAQATADEAADDEDPGRVEGAWFIDGVTRMDDQQHMISALLRAEAIAAAGPTERNGPAPPAWLWLLALVAAVNPLRVALALRPSPPDDTPQPAPVGPPGPGGSPAPVGPPGPGGSPAPVGPPGRAEPTAAPIEPTERAGRTVADRPGERAGRRDMALGLGAGGALLLVAACAASTLVSWAHVSPPALRLAAGVLAIAGGVSALLTLPLPAVPLGAGRAATLVPAALAVAHPVATVAVVSAAVDRGLPIVASAAMVAVASTLPGVAALDRPGEGPRRLVTWGARLTGLALATASALLVLDALYAP